MKIKENFEGKWKTISEKAKLYSLTNFLLVRDFKRKRLTKQRRAARIPILLTSSKLVNKM
ncbi:hypothetical protein OUZ56_008387 [Daphnia magna]|uniref:Uncharacterized protein n=1 Tax=Daphnia magna TaxID=35525 RepID=A0ABR0AD78_9CRUS|nr:hypothetical protein OUZ56_008387 [Daphnia magna]